MGPAKTYRAEVELLRAELERQADRLIRHQRRIETLTRQRDALRRRMRHADQRIRQLLGESLGRRVAELVRPASP